MKASVKKTKGKPEIGRLSISWKFGQQKKQGGWPQKHSDHWKWHYIADDIEYSTGVYYSSKEAVLECKNRFK